MSLLSITSTWNFLECLHLQGKEGNTSQSSCRLLAGRHRSDFGYFPALSEHMCYYSHELIQRPEKRRLNRCHCQGLKESLVNAVIYFKESHCNVAALWKSFPFKEEKQNIVMGWQIYAPSLITWTTPHFLDLEVCVMHMEYAYEESYN